MSFLYRGASYLWYGSKKKQSPPTTQKDDVVETQEVTSTVDSANAVETVTANAVETVTASAVETVTASAVETVTTMVPENIDGNISDARAMESILGNKQGYPSLPRTRKQLLLIKNWLSELCLDLNGRENMVVDLFDYLDTYYGPGVIQRIDPEIERDLQDMAIELVAFYNVDINSQFRCVSGISFENYVNGVFDFPPLYSCNRDHAGVMNQVTYYLNTNDKMGRKKVEKKFRQAIVRQLYRFIVDHKTLIIPHARLLLTIQNKIREFNDSGDLTTPFWANEILLWGESVANDVLSKEKVSAPVPMALDERKGSNVIHDCNSLGGFVGAAIRVSQDQSRLIKEYEETISNLKRESQDLRKLVETKEKEITMKQSAHDKEVKRLCDIIQFKEELLQCYTSAK